MPAYGCGIEPTGAAEPPRPRRRAVGPPGSRPSVDEPHRDEPESSAPTEDDERLRSERPPHHDREH